MPIVGTAGHVDHGKSTLVRALTGTDPDRWTEEKERGLTIDLGFASTTIADHEIGFVDVPGHERFIKNMLAGVVGVDCALLVVAADSGWMPQTEEHTRILDLVGARTGVIAITRSDLVDAETVELAILEATDEVEGTALEAWPIVAVSAVTGDGIDNLRKALGDALTEHAVDASGPFRMWVDRVFHIHGSGVVATGSVLRGELKVDDSVEILPGAGVARVRGLHQHDQPVALVGPGSRAAVNLGNVELHDLDRGFLLAAPGTATDSKRFIMTWQPSRGFDSLPRRGAFHVHSGTADRSATVRKLDHDLILVTMPAPIPIIAGDRVIVRESGRQSVVGGGTVVHPHPARRLAISDMSVIGESELPFADRILRYDGVTDAELLAKATGGSTPTNGTLVNGRWVVDGLFDRLASEAHDLISNYHIKYPLRPGMPVGPLSDQLGFAREIVTAAVDASEQLDINDGFATTADFSVTLDDSDVAAWAAAQASLESSFAVPRSHELGLDPDLLHALIRRGDVIQIDTDHVLTAAQIERITAGLSDLPDGFTVSQFGEYFGMPRRLSVPLLEWFDKRGVTRRDGAVRTLRPR